MYWEKIDGWFSYQELYDKMIDKYDNTIFVEIGAFKGKSTTYMGEVIKKSNKNIKFYTIDVFTIMPQQAEQGFIYNLGFYDEFIRNIEPVKEYITPLKMKSSEACKLFEDESIDFILIDGDHSYPQVKQDIMLWYPKLKVGGTIGGDDWHWQGDQVKQAVEEYFKYSSTQTELINDTVWYRTKQ